MGSDQSNNNNDNINNSYSNYNSNYINNHYNNYINNHYNNNIYQKAKILWVFPDDDHVEENKNYQNQIDEIPSFTLNSFINIDESISFLKNIKFEKTIIIVSGSYSERLFNEIGKIINELNVIPEIIIFTSSKRYKLIKENIFNLDKYNLFNNNLVFSFFEPVLKQLKRERNINYSYYQDNNEGNLLQKDECHFTFEYIQESKQLIFPLYLFDYYLDPPNQNQIEEFNKLLLSNYGDVSELKELIEQLLLNIKIPFQILIKYWLRAYTMETNFYKTMNKELRERSSNRYDILIKVLYHGLNQKYITPFIENNLYRGSSITKKELQYIIKSLNQKQKNLPGCICYNKSFLSTSISEEVAKEFMKKNENREKVLYIIKAEDTLNNDNISNADIQNLSVIEREKEILFFPFSHFEITNVNYINNDDYYELNLVYLGKYKNQIKKNQKIPKTKFVEDVLKTSIMDKIEIEKESAKFEFDLKEFIPLDIKKGYIIATYKITREDLDKKIQILNSSSINKKEIEEICDIYYINGEKINFSFQHTFCYPGEYKLKIVFKKLLTNACNLFYDCKNLISLDFKNFKTNYITNMNNMFNGCTSLESLNVLNFKTKQVTTMKRMFFDCKALKSLDLSSFNTVNVNNMNKMFGNCSSLNILDLSKFNTEKVNDMSCMFQNCISLFFINLSSFNSKNVIDMSYIFYNCNSLKSLYISNFEINNKTNITKMFHKCNNLEYLYISKYFLNESIDMSYMFDNHIPQILLEKFDSHKGRRYSNITTIDTFRKSIKK